MSTPSTGEPAVERRLIVIPDCENDTDSVRASLRYAGLIGKRGNLKAKSRGVHIVQTGDLLHKNAPNPAVVDFWEQLRSSAGVQGCSLHILAGNHELEVWQRLHAGQGMGLKRREQRAVTEFIRRTRLFHVDGSILFIHGYPTVKLLRDLREYRSRTGKDANSYNEDCFRKAFDSAKQLARYAYPRGGSAGGSLLHDVQDPARYYRTHGREVTDLLGSLGIDLVVHGHRPERSGIQADYELRSRLPGIRMISNDTQIRLRGLGATVIRRAENGSTDVLFVNRTNTIPGYRKEVRRALRGRERPIEAPWNPAMAGVRRGIPEQEYTDGRGLAMIVSNRFACR